MSRASGTPQGARAQRADVEIDLAADAVARSGVGELIHGDAERSLEAANRLRRAADALVTELVLDARERGATWAEIGETLGVSTQAAHQKYRYASTDDG
ncbi:hypothetical protein [Actinospongicola halichondriae]|uniref:hypothetical protein n=1 Tax=Actinospongicola halichondriae TaxID=3236844 RepID=UPI003D42B3EF